MHMTYLMQHDSTLLHSAWSRVWYAISVIWNDRRQNSWTVLWICCAVFILRHSTQQRASESSENISLCIYLRFRNSSGTTKEQNLIRQVHDTKWLKLAQKHTSNCSLWKWSCDLTKVMLVLETHPCNPIWMSLSAQCDNDQFEFEVFFKQKTSRLSKDIWYHVRPYSFLCFQISKSDFSSRLT